LNAILNWRNWWCHQGNRSPIQNSTSRLHQSLIKSHEMSGSTRSLGFSGQWMWLYVASQAQALLMCAPASQREWPWSSSTSGLLGRARCGQI
jgi:hypothetical protein